MSMPLDIGAGLAAMKELDGAVGIVLKYLKRLAQDKQGAGLRLSAALAEVRASCEALNAAVSSFLDLGIRDDALGSGSTTLLNIQGGALAAKVEQGVGGCHRIGRIYQLDLDRWFSNVFRSGTPEYQELECAFSKLSEADAAMFTEMRETAYKLQESADQALNLLIAGQSDAARNHIRQQIPELLPLRKSINQVLAKIEEINAELIRSGLG